MFLTPMPLNFEGRKEGKPPQIKRLIKRSKKYGLFVDDFVYVWSVGSVGALVRAFAALNAGSKWA